MRPEVPRYKKNGRKEYNSEPENFGSALGRVPSSSTWDALPNTHPLPEELRTAGGPEYYSNEAPGRLSNHRRYYPEKIGYQRDPLEFTPTMAYANKQYHGDERAASRHDGHYMRTREDPSKRLGGPKSDWKRAADRVLAVNPPKDYKFDYKSWNDPPFKDKGTVYDAAAERLRQSNMLCCGRDAQNQRYPSAYPTYDKYESHITEHDSRRRVSEEYRKALEYHREGYRNNEERMYEEDQQREAENRGVRQRDQIREDNRRKKAEKRASRQSRLGTMDKKRFSGPSSSSGHY